MHSTKWCTYILNIVRCLHLFVRALEHSFIAMNCVACNNSIARGELLNCKMCRGVYHFACLGMAPTFFNAHHTELSRTWKCHTCNNVTQRRNDRNDSTPTHNQFEVLRVDADMSCDDMQLNNSVTSECDTDAAHAQPQPTKSAVTCSQRPGAAEQASAAAVITYEQFSNLLDNKLDTLRSSVISEINATIKKEISCAIERLRSEFTETTDFLAAEQQDLKNEIRNAHLKVSTLETESSKVQSELNELKRRMITLEKASRNHNIEIQMLPEKNSENLTVIMKKLCDTIKAPITDSDICAVRRVAKVDATSKRPRNVLVTLPSERHRDHLLSAYKRYNKAHKNEPLSTRHLGMPGETQIIYLAEHLAPECKSLHAVARKLAKQREYLYG